MPTEQELWRQALLALPNNVQEALRDPRVTDISINPNGAVWVDGFLEKQQLAQLDDVRRRQFLLPLASACERNLTPDTPLFDGYIESGRVRIEGGIRPASAGTAISIRKLANQIIPLSQYLADGILSQEAGELLKNAVKYRANILIAGSTGAGKTTLLNALVDVIANETPMDRVLSIEDTQEIVLNSPDSWQLFTTPSIPMAEQTRRCLRRNPDRVIVGEVRDAAMYEVLRIWNTGHAGGLTTIHAGRTPYKSSLGAGSIDMMQDVIDRIEAMIAEKMRVTVEIKRMIARSIDLVVTIERYSQQEATQKTGKRVDQLTVADRIRISGIWLLEDFVEGEYRHRRLI